MLLSYTEPSITVTVAKEIHALKSIAAYYDGLAINLNVTKTDAEENLKEVLTNGDAYAFPETFYLGAKNSREVVFSVLHDACTDGELSIPEAVEAAKDILARNAIRFYKISSTNITAP
ncbi:hypothetical protein glysoja_007903 [Glycine soja]|nr:hypothetical protein glysoja_007903 [Glycine soja]